MVRAFGQDLAPENIINFLFPCSSDPSPQGELGAKKHQQNQPGVNNQPVDHWRSSAYLPQQYVQLEKGARYSGGYFAMDILPLVWRRSPTHSKL